MPLPLLPRRSSEAYSARRVRVLLAEDMPHHQEMYGLLLERQAELELVEVLGNPELVEMRVAQLAPDVVLLDHQFDGHELTGLELSARLRRSHPKLGIVLFTALPTVRLLDQFLAATKGGGRGFLVKGRDDGEDLPGSLRRVARGMDILSADVKDAYERHRRVASFAPEDLAILELMSEGVPYASIGKRLKAAAIAAYELSERTIQDRVRRMADKLDLPEFDDEGDPIDRRIRLVIAYREFRDG